MHDPEYSTKIVVITGASSGFGRGTAIELARRGAALALASRNADALHEVERECAAHGAAVLVAPTDVSRPDEVERLGRDVVSRFGRFDVWINNAGVGAIGRFHEIPLAHHVQVIQTDLVGQIAGSHVALAHFRQRGAGTLINVASVIGKIPAPLYASYVAAKFGVVGLSDSLRQELAQDEAEAIHVCTVMPMAHDTPFFEHAANYTGRQAAPIPPTYDPQVTIEALVKLVAHPEDEMITGWQGGAFNLFHKLMPGAVEKMMASRTEKAQLEQAPLAPITSGTVHTPTDPATPR